MANSIATRNLPTEKDFGESLDAKWAWKHFGGLDLDAAYKRFCEDSSCYQEDFMFMETAAFEFYFPVVDKFLREISSDDALAGDCEAWILGRGVNHQLEFPRDPINAELLGKIQNLCRYVITHLSQYSPSSEDQKRIEDSWVEVERKVFELKNRG